MMQLPNLTTDNKDINMAYRMALATISANIIPFKDGIVKQLPDFAALEEEFGVEIYHHMEVGQEVREYHTNLDGCGYIVARSQTIEEAIKNVEMVLAIIREKIF